MAWTLTTLQTAIKDYVVEWDSDFDSNLNVIITQAEDRILKNPNIQIPDFRKNVEGSMTADSQYLGIPDDFLAPYSLGVDNSGTEFLIFKDVNFIREAYPVVTDTATPRYYGIWDDEFFIVGPTPDANYDVELHYFHKPDSITVSGDGTSWLGTNAESCLFSGCILEAYIFLKGDADTLAKYEERYKEALAELGVLSEGRNTTDQYRSGR